MDNQTAWCTELIPAGLGQMFSESGREFPRVFRERPRLIRDHTANLGIVLYRTAASWAAVYSLFSRFEGVSSINTIYI